MKKLLAAINNFFTWIKGLFSAKKRVSPSIVRFYGKLNATEAVMKTHRQDMTLLQCSYEAVMHTFLSHRVIYGMLKPSQESKDVTALMPAKPARAYVSLSPLTFLKWVKQPVAFMMKALGVSKGSPDINDIPPADTDMKPLKASKVKTAEYWEQKNARLRADPEYRQRYMQKLDDRRAIASPAYAKLRMINADWDKVNDELHGVNIDNFFGKVKFAVLLGKVLFKDRMREKAKAAYYQECDIRRAAATSLLAYYQECEAKPTATITPSAAKK